MEALIVTKGIIALILKISNILLHSLGLYLLTCLHKNGGGNVQMVYIMNLSATELIINILSFLRNLPRVVSFSSFNSKKFKEIVMYSYIFDYAILKFCLYMWMLYITVDRVCGVLLTLTYPRYWNVYKAKCLVAATWLFSVAIFISMALFYEFDKDEVHLFMISNYFIIIFDFTFVLISTSSYALIFYRFQKTRKNSYLGTNTSQQNLWGIFRRSRFYISVLLISTYIVFTIFPDLMWTFGAVGNAHGFLMSILYAVSYLADGVIYIFMQKKVKKILWKRLRRCVCFGDIISNYVERLEDIPNGVHVHNVTLLEETEIEEITRCDSQHDNETQSISMYTTTKFSKRNLDVEGADAYTVRYKC